MRRTRLRAVSVKRRRVNQERARVVAELKDAQVAAVGCVYCERCHRPGPVDAHERIRRSQDSTALTNPAVISLLCRRCHRWVTENPVAAHAEGWVIWSWEK